MADKPRQKRNLMGGPGRGNYQMWVIIILISSIIGFTYLSNNSSVITISDRRFEEMMLSNDVQRVVLIKNKDLVEVTLKPEALQNTKYKIELEKGGPFSNAEGPHYQFKIVDTKNLCGRLPQDHGKAPAGTKNKL